MVATGSTGGGGVTHPRFGPRRSTAGGTWWSRAWLRAVEEAAFATPELRAGRAAARRGDVGAITVSAGTVVAAVVEGDDAHTVTCTVPVLPEDDRQLLVELVAAESGRVAALLAGDLPHRLVEEIEEAGVELLPYGGELGAACTCTSWMDPCPHALAVLTQVGWLVQRDPFVLIALRGLARDDLLAQLRAHGPGTSGTLRSPGAVPEVEEDLVVAEDAARRAAQLLGQLEGAEREG